MATQMAHSGGLVDAILELGFDEAKYFEGTITGTASGFTITPPARRLQILNLSTTDDVFFTVNDGNAETTVGFVPGNNIKLRPSCSFELDYDAVTEISFITEGASVEIEGLLGWKGSAST